MQKGKLFILKVCPKGAFNIPNANQKCSVCGNPFGLKNCTQQSVVNTGAWYLCLWCGSYVNEDFTPNEIREPEEPLPLTRLAELLNDVSTDENGIKLIGVDHVGPLNTQCLTFSIMGELVHVGIDDIFVEASDMATFMGEMSLLEATPEEEDEDEEETET